MNAGETYFYVKERRKFGRQCLFGRKNAVIAHIPTSVEKQRNFILRDPVDQSVDFTRKMAFSEVNTENATYKSRGINHAEGGWPKDVNCMDEEQTTRQRKKIERDEEYSKQIMASSKKIFEAINENNAVNVVDQYFENIDPIDIEDNVSARNIQRFSDKISNVKRAASHISFSPNGSHMAIAYASRQYKYSGSSQSFIWDIDNTQEPILKLNCRAECTQIEFNIRDKLYAAGGLANGTVCVWDTRTGGDPMLFTELEKSHRERVTSLRWISSKKNTEFFTGSSDGQLMWWDTRKFTEPYERLYCDSIKTDEQDLSRSYGCSVLEFEYTIPTRFMVGTQQGWILFGNRKGQTASERLPNKIKCSNGIIHSLERNPAFLKNLLIVSEFAINVWSEDCRNNPILWTSSQLNEMTCGAWSRQRCSLIFIGSIDGVFECWDLLVNQKKAVISMKISDYPITHIRAHENGYWVAVGDANGNVYMIELSKNLSMSQKNDRSYLSALFERETQREKILESRLREMKLKEKQSDEPSPNANDDLTEKSPLDVDNYPNEKVIKKQTEDEFVQILIEEEKRRMNKHKNIA